jgi:hypothetical protein
MLHPAGSGVFRSQQNTHHSDSVSTLLLWIQWRLATVKCLTHTDTDYISTYTLLPTAASALPAICHCTAVEHDKVSSG